LIDDANAAGKTIGVVAQNEQDEDPTKEDIHNIGTVARILRVLKCLMEHDSYSSR
jgi:ATP-dependent Lon protease